jgi:hypothetical protein
MNKVSITHLSNAHNDWLRALDFYKQEIKILKKRLTEIAGKNSHRDVLKQVDHFENQFMIQANNINKLSHEIKANITSIGKEARSSSAGYIDGELLEMHKSVGQKFEAEEMTVNEIRHSFNQFSAQWI